MLIKRILFYSRKVNYYRHYYNLKQIIWQRKSRVYAGLTDFLIDATVKLPGIVFAKKLLSMLQLSSGALCGVETELTEAFTQFDELGVTEWKQQH